MSAKCSLVHCGLDRGETFLHVIAHLGMREYVELVGANCSQGLLGYVGRVEARLLEACTLCSQFCSVTRRGQFGRRSIPLRSISCALADVSAYEPGTKHRHANSKRIGLQGQPFRQGYDGGLACRVGAKPQSALQSGHGSGVDDVATFTMGAHARQETTDAVDDSHQIDIDRPSPGVERNLVYAAAAGDARVI